MHMCVSSRDVTFYLYCFHFVPVVWLHVMEVGTYNVDVAII